MITLMDQATTLMSQATLMDQAIPKIELEPRSVEVVAEARYLTLASSLIPYSPKLVVEGFW